MIKLKTLIGTTFFALMLGNPAQAVTVSAFFDLATIGHPSGNDCGANGFFGHGGGFDECSIFAEGEEISPVIIKFENDDTDGLVEDGINQQPSPDGFPSVTGTEWAFTNNNSTGTWTYTKNDLTDPDVRFWTAKAGGGPSGGGFNLFWDIGNAAQNATCMAGGASNYNLACLNLALAVLTGDWATPEQKGLSHLTFFDTGTPKVIPVPAAFWLFGTALIGFIGISRRTKV